MDNKVAIDSTRLRLLYERNKPYLIPIFVIIACFLIFLTIIVPQIQDLFKFSQEAKNRADKLLTMKNNLTILSGISETTLDSELQLASTALPSGKDFDGILTAISLASQRSGVSFGNFEFQVGDLSKVEDKGGQIPFLKLNLSINGSMKAMSAFLDEISKTLPLSELENVDLSNGLSSITTVFYYKPFPRLNYDDSLPIILFSKKETDLLKRLSTFNASQQMLIENVPVLSTPSASSPF